MNIVLLIIGIGAVCALPILVVYLTFYRRTSQAIWYRALKNQLDVLRQFETQVQEKQRTIDEDFASIIRKDHLERYLNELPSYQLEKYSGIGPATISSLRAHGLKYVHEVLEYSLEQIDGIGEKKSSSIKVVCRSHLKEAESRFQAKACREAIECDQAIAKEQQRRVVVAQELAQDKQYLIDWQAHLAPFQKLAENIHLLNFILRKLPPGNMPPIPAMAKQAPRLETRKETEPESVTMNQANRRNQDKTHPPAPSRTQAKPEQANEADIHGDLFAQELQRTKNNSKKQPTGLPRLRTACRLCFVIAKSDGRVTLAERATINKILIRHAGRDKELAAQVPKLLQEVELNNSSFEEVVAEVVTNFQQKEWPELLEIIREVADGSGNHTPEWENVRRFEEFIREKQHVVVAKEEPPPVITPPPEPPKPTIEQCRNNLEIATDTELTAELVRRQYHLLMDRYAATRFEQHAGEFQDLALRKREAIATSATFLLDSMGEQLELPSAKPPEDIRHNPDLDDIFGV